MCGPGERHGDMRVVDEEPVQKEAPLEEATLREIAELNKAGYLEISGGRFHVRHAGDSWRVIDSIKTAIRIAREARAAHEEWLGKTAQQ